MHALRQAHTALVPDGLMLDLHPYTAAIPVEREGERLGELDAAEFARTAQATEDGLRRCVDYGLFSLESERHFDVLEHFETAEALLSTVGEWAGTRIPRGLAARVRRSRPPFQVRERIVLSLFRRRRGRRRR